MSQGGQAGVAEAAGERQGSWGPLLAREGMAEGKGRAENFKVRRILAFSCINKSFFLGNVNFWLNVQSATFFRKSAWQLVLYLVHRQFGLLIKMAGESHRTFCILATYYY